MGLRSYLPDPWKVLKWSAGSALVALGGLGGLLYLAQSSLIYPSNVPSGSRTQVATPDEFDMPFEDLELTTPDSVRIKAYLMLQQGEKPESRPTVVLLHANAGNVGHRLPIAKVFYKKMRCNVLALSYRGYGKSEGKANEQGLKLDAQTALDYVLSHPTLEKTKIFLYGQSIGGAVAIFLASQNSSRTHGLIIENTFLSLPKLVPMIMPFLSSFMFLLHQIWPSEDRIKTLPSSFPVLFLAGEEDELVVPSHMKELFAICSSKEKEWKSFPHGTHNDTCIQPGYFHDIALFLSKYTDLPLPPLPSLFLLPTHHQSQHPARSSRARTSTALSWLIRRKGARSRMKVERGVSMCLRRGWRSCSSWEYCMPFAKLRVGRG
ncbi:Alpha/Beta hydrolase protein [Leucosporidium creatinivorum]|uniref:Alpha/Beta hydrolase protein n=1 Tax=Leucosporidium creatinivorum TaxID=106004 RepID=A0A1Y2FVI6_9BASI|nr:Alpha/Beta hydrolase protein [Leucosporidium creatinivorum]